MCSPGQCGRRARFDRERQHYEPVMCLPGQLEGRRIGCLPAGYQRPGGARLLVRAFGHMIERLQIQLPAGAVGEFSCPELALCADS